MKRWSDLSKRLRITNFLSRSTRILLKITLFSFFIFNVANAQGIVDTTDYGFKVYLYAEKQDIYAVGKVIDLRVADIQLMNFRDDRFIVFDPKSDNLFIDRHGNLIKAALFDYEYLENEIYPGHQMKLHFYLPQFKDITVREVYFITYNSTKDTLRIMPTSDERIAVYVKKFEKKENRQWLFKLAQALLFATAAFFGVRAL